MIPLVCSLDQLSTEDVFESLLQATFIDIQSERPGHPTHAVPDLIQRETGVAEYETPAFLASSVEPGKGPNFDSQLLDLPGQRDVVSPSG